MKRFLLGAFAVALILAVAKLLVATVSVMLLVFAGVLFGVFLSGISRWVSDRTPLPYHGALYLLVAVLVISSVGGAYYMGAQTARQVSDLTDELQSAWHKVNERLQRYKWMPDDDRIREIVNSGTDGNTELMSRAAKSVKSVLWGVTSAVVIFFVGVYSAHDPWLYHDGIVKLFPQQHRRHAGEVFEQLRATMGRWIVGRLFSMFVIGVATAIGLAFLGVPLPISLGVLAALLTFIPNFGPVLAAVPQALLAVEVSPQTALYVVIFNIVLQGIESYLLTPIVQRYQVTLPPALTITMQLLLGATVGIIGVMIAAPLTAAGMVIIEIVYIRDRLGDKTPSELLDET